VLDQLIKDEKRRTEMKKLGIAQAALFNWDRTAEQHLDVYKTMSTNR
jgi:hypothetical protein